MNKLCERPSTSKSPIIAADQRSDLPGKRCGALGVLVNQPVAAQLLGLYGIDGLPNMAAKVWSKVLISRTPRRRQLARRQRSRACRVGYSS